MASRLNYTVSLAAEEDIPTLVDIQFKVFSFFSPEVLIRGRDIPENQAKVVERHLEDLRNESGLRIIKVEIHPDAPTAPHTEGSKTIIGFCMICLPNEDAKTALERIPRSIRPRPLPIELPFIDEPLRRGLAEKQMNRTYSAIQPIIANRPCAWVRYMAVLPEYQRHGVGRAIMEYGCRLFDERGVDAALQATVAGQGLYRQFGFEIVGKNYYEAETEVVSDDNGQESKDVIETAIMWRNAARKSDMKAG